MNSPVTAAGRALLSKTESLNSRAFPLVTVADILAIEAEAAAGQREALLEALRECYGYFTAGGGRIERYERLLAASEPEGAQGQ